MKRLLILFLACLFSSCNTQTGDNQKEVEQEKDIEKETSIALKKLFSDSSTNNNLLDTTAIKLPADSGQIKNGLKVGLWNNYSFDTAGIGQKIVINGVTTLNLSATLQKETGKYVMGKRDGVWVLYKMENRMHWNRQSVTHYKNGRKDGEQVIYQGHGIKYQTPLIVTHWKNGIESGIGEIYDVNPPHNLQKRYNAINGENWTLETYYPTGQLNAKFSDTLIDKKPLRYFRQYFESGKLVMTGYYKNGEELFGMWTTYYENGKTETIFTHKAGKLDGSFKYFHDNGKPWTERIFKDGRLISVLYNYDRNGKKKNPGTLKNGTGTLNLYDADGMLIETQNFVNGEKITGGSDREV